MANKLIGKGTIFQVEISASLTTIPQMTSVEHSGAGAQTVAAPTLDGGAGIPYIATGYSEPGQISCAGYWDSDDATHQFVAALITDPETLIPLTINLSYTDASPLALGGTVAGLTDFGITTTLDDITEFSATFQLADLLDYNGT